MTESEPERGLDGGELLDELGPESPEGEPFEELDLNDALDWEYFP